MGKLVCPRDKGMLAVHESHLECEQHHRYPIFEGVPVMLVEEASETHATISTSLKEAAGETPVWKPADGEDVDPFVQVLVAHTSGHLYDPVVGKLKRYPIPELRLPRANGETLLDIGCNWGRWTVAAARKGYDVIGLDPSLGAILAARRVCRALNIEAEFVVGDARFLPFATGSFDVVFSYSVIQHFSKSDARSAFAEIARSLAPGGKSLVQMPNAFGVRSIFHQAKRGFVKGKDFDVRYWTPKELIAAFTATIGPSKLSVDGFGGLGIQPADRDLFPARYRLLIDVSESLRRLTGAIPPLINLADSLYIESIRADATANSSR